MSAQTVHANCLVVGTRGIVIQGPSGSGKSELTDLLIEAAGNKGNLGVLVADDRVYLSSCRGTLVARVPETISGLMEVRGRGVVETVSMSAAKVDLLVDLKPLGEIERLPESAFGSRKLGGVLVPVCTCPQNRPWESARLIRWRLRQLFPEAPDYI
ncbi:MAG: HPr kinase/phosphatase C-terminal domain-containing protein [Roseibium sp.]|uniref:HPr kinase/phosphorylase n=1 Tax=Roseibium sp. TaxID=1936156 RepID=UPI003D9C5090